MVVALFLMVELSMSLNQKNIAFSFASDLATEDPAAAL